jgi:hypothetical protein
MLEKSNTLNRYRESGEVDQQTPLINLERLTENHPVHSAAARLSIWTRRLQLIERHAAG